MMNSATSETLGPTTPLAVCIPTRNRHGELRRSLFTVVPAARNAHAQVWICDQSPVPFTVPPWATDCVSVLHRPDVGGLPAARNVLLQHVNADVLVYLDDDTDLAGDALSAVATAAFNEPQCAGWGAVCETRSRRQRHCYRLLRLGCFRDPRRLTAGRCDTATTALFGCAFAVRREALLAVRGADARLIGYGLGEDADICTRLSAAGYALRFLKPWRAWHRRSGTNRHNRNRQWRDTVSFIRWWAARHGRRNPATLIHAGLLLAAASAVWLVTWRR